MGVRKLVQSEWLELLEEPREERSNGTLRVRGRSVSSGRVGWVTQTDGNLKPWMPIYRCVSATTLSDNLSVKMAAQKLCQLNLDDTIELIEGPREDSDVGILRIRARAVKDGSVGWVSMAGSGGEPLLVNA